MEKDEFLILKLHHLSPGIEAVHEVIKLEIITRTEGGQVTGIIAVEF